MVSTRHHPRPFPEPSSPTARPSSSASNNDSKPTASKSSKSPTPASSSSSGPSPLLASPIEKASAALTRVTGTKSTPTVKTSESSTSLSTPQKRKRKSTASTDGPAAARSSDARSYSHIPPPVLVTWLLLSLPLIIWDTGYVILRPHTMPGGALHSPIWKPYALYGTVDYMYGWPAWNEGDGFTAAQGSLNAVELAMYVYYLYVLVCGAGFEVLKFWDANLWSQESAVSVKGEGVATAVVICFAAAVMTLSKTVLYWLNEYFSNFAYIGHNTWANLFWLWIIPNGLWLVFPTYIIWALGAELVGALHTAEAGVKED